MLRIDENSKTLVPPTAAEVVPDAAPAAEAILEMACASWDAFMRELGLTTLKLMARDPVPGVDVLAFDEATGRVAVVQFTGGTNQLAAALHGAAMICGLDAASLASLNKALTAAVPGDSPQIVLVGAGLEEHSGRTVDFLVRRHGMEISSYTLVVFRKGSEKLMTVHRDYPPTDAQPAHGAVVSSFEGLTPVASANGAHSVAPPAA